MGKLFMIVIHTVSTSSSSVQELLHSILTDLLCHHTLQIIQYQVYVGRDIETMYRAGKTLTPYTL